MTDNEPKTLTIHRSALSAAVAAILVDNGVHGQEKIDHELEEFYRALYDIEAATGDQDERVKVVIHGTQLDPEIENQLDAAGATRTHGDVAGLSMVVVHGARAICLALKRVEDMLYEIDQRQIEERNR